MRPLFLVVSCVLLLCPTGIALADAPEPRAEATAAAHEAETAFDRPFAFASYGALRGGSYLAGGVGGRARWEPWPFFGVEVYLEATLVDWPGALRHDYPNGFNVYVPIRFGRFRLRPFFGFCDVVSLIEPAQEGSPRADDVMLGAHLGVGAEFSFGTHWSLFADAQVDGYAGHDRATARWTGNVDEELRAFFTAQLNLGVQFHFGAAR